MWDKIKNIAVVLSFLLILGSFAAAGLLRRPDAVSDSERRPLAQLPEYSAADLLNGRYFAGLETYTVDQFPLRDTFRRFKALVQTRLLGRQDNNGYYAVDGYLSRIDAPLNRDSVAYAAGRMMSIYDKYLKGGDHKVIYAVVPDKNYFMAEDYGCPAMDYAALQDILHQRLGGQMAYVDLFELLTLADYYKTDTHWRQERLEKVAQRLAAALNKSDRLSGAYDVVERSPFYGVYSGQSALPCAPETLRYLTNEVLAGCIVRSAETGAAGPMYDVDRFTGQDPYELFLSGSQAILTIENPANTSGDRLIVFRDSFGSSLTPLLAEAYSEIVVVDIRYVNSAFLDRFITFTGDEDVLFLYSTLVLNSSAAMK